MVWGDYPDEAELAQLRRERSGIAASQPSGPKQPVLSLNPNMNGQSGGTKKGAGCMWALTDYVNCHPTCRLLGVNDIKSRLPTRYDVFILAAVTQHGDKYNIRPFATNGTLQDITAKERRGFRVLTTIHIPDACRDEFLQHAQLICDNYSQ